MSSPGQGSRACSWRKSSSAPASILSSIEKAGEVGGTWRDNTFPGLYVDVLSRQYEFPFQPNYDWSRKYAPGPEIQAYIKKVADDRGLRKFIRFNEEIVEARFTDERWHVETAKAKDRCRRRLRLRAPAFCTGRFIPTSPAATASPARRSTRRLGPRRSI